VLQVLLTVSGFFFFKKKKISTFQKIKILVTFNRRKSNENVDVKKSSFDNLPKLRTQSSNSEMDSLSDKKSASLKVFLY